MKKILFLGRNKRIVMLMISLMPLAATTQTVPNLYPAKCISRFIKDYMGIDLFPTDTTKRKIKKPLNSKKDTCNFKRCKSDSVFVNHDKQIKEQILKTWKY